MSFTYKSFSKTLFYENCKLNNINTKVLFEILDLIDASILFNNLDTALTRLKKALPIAEKLYPRELERKVPTWLKCIESIEPHYISVWFRESVIFSERSQRNSENRLGANQEKHPFHGALITSLSSSEDETHRAKMFAQLIAFRMLQKHAFFDKSPDNKELTEIALEYVIDSVKKAGDENSIWFELLKKLTEAKFTNPTSYLERQLTEEIGSSSDKNLSDLHKKFINHVQNTARELLKNIRDLTVLAPIKKINGGAQDLPLLIHIDHPTRPTINFDPKALAPDDNRTSIDIVVTLPFGIKTEPLSEDEQQLSIKSAQYETEYSNQFLPWRWEALNPYELGELASYLSTCDSNDFSIDDKTIAFLIALTLATGQDLATLLNFKIVNTLTDALNSKAANIIVLDSFLWCHKIPVLNNRFIPTEEQSLSLTKVGDRVWLTLPKIITNFINTLFTKNSDGLISTLLDLEISQTKDQINSQFTDFRKSRKIRSTLSRCEKVLFDKALLVSNSDELAAFTIVGSSLQRPPAGLYYTSFEISTLQNIYNKATDKIFGKQKEARLLLENTPYQYVGSKLKIKKAILLNYITDLKEQCPVINSKTQYTLSEIILAHNNYATYVVSMLNFITGHRAVTDPFHDSSCFFLQHESFIITDKVESNAHDGRIVWLGNLATKQIELYFQHLAALAILIKPFNPDLASCINKLPNPTEQHALPLFFYLNETDWESIKPTSLKKLLPNTWNLPLNFSRHLLATELRSGSVPSEYIAAQLGHIQIGQQPLGKFSMLSSEIISSTLTPALNVMLESYGWVAMEGIKTNKKEWISPNASEQFTLRDFGPELRKAKKIKQAEHDFDFVKNIISSVFAREKIDEDQYNIPDSIIDGIEADIIQQSTLKKRGPVRCLNFFRKLLLHKRNTGEWNSKIIGLAAELKYEAAPLSHTDGIKIHQIEAIKKEFMASILTIFRNKQFPPEPGDEVMIIEYLAYCTLSAILYGRIYDKELIEDFSHSILFHAQVYNKKLWVDFKSTDSKDKSSLDERPESIKYRWLPDPLTSILITRLHRSIENNTNPSYNYKKIKTRTTTLIRALAFNANISRCRNDSSWTIDKVIKYSKKEAVLYMPGFIRAFIEGETTSQSLPEDTWKRFISDEQVVLTDYENISMTGTAIHRPTYATSESQEVKTDKAIIKKVRLALAEAQSVSSGLNPAPTDLRNSSQRRTQLKLDLKLILSDYSSSASSTLLYSIEWVLDLLTYGTSKTQSLSLRTIYEYYYANSKPLIEQACHLDLLTLNEDELISLYNTILEYFKDSTRASRAYPLSLFHNFLFNTYLIEDVDFYEIEPRYALNTIDANIITDIEYKRTYKLLYEDKYEDRVTRVRNTLLLCLLCKSGPRPSEAIRFLISDIIISDDPQLYVRNNNFGTGKTYNAIRQIPLLINFDEEETALIHEWLEYRTKTEKSNPKKPLFTEGRQAHIAIRQNATNRITLALRIATGDNSVRLRHLRHTFASYYISYACPVSEQFPTKQLVKNNNQSELLSKIFGSTSPTRRFLYQVAAMLGHGSPATTLRNYTHCLDIITGEYIWSTPVVVTGAELGYLCGYSKNSIRNQLMRTKSTMSHAELKKFAPQLLRNKIPEKLQFDIEKITIKDQSLPSTNDINNKSKHVTLDELAEILRYAGMGAQIELIASRFILPVEFINKWVKKAKDMELVSGYTRFQLNEDDKKIEGWSFLQVNRRNIDRPARDINLLRKYKNYEFIKKIQSTTTNEVFISALDIWKESYKTNATGIYCKDEGDATLFINALTFLNIKPESICIIIPLNLQSTYYKNRDELNNWIRSMDIPIDNIQLANYTIFNRAENAPSPGIAIKVDKEPTHKDNEDSISISAEFINYYFFLASVI